MPLANEFSIIERYFKVKAQSSSRTDVIQSIGDDCAIVQPRSGYQLVFSMDTLIEGVHFPHNTSPANIATKALAVNLSDLAAMGAEPAWFTLALSLPENNQPWLEVFSSALLEMANRYNIQLIGGDTTRSPTLSITIQVHGYVKDRALLRSTAKVNDYIAVTGELGAAAMGLQLELYPEHNVKLSELHKEKALAALHRPVPQIEMGMSLTHYSRCAIDISDGLYADLGHILEQSQCAGILNLDKLPLAGCLQNLSKDEAYKIALTGGDDYQLCFTLSEKALEEIKKQDFEFSVIGCITNGRGLSLLENNRPYQLGNQKSGYDHFI